MRDDVTTVSHDRAVLLYSTAADVAKVFWEWRHKVMTRFFLVAGSAFISAGWLYNSADLRRWAWVPFVLGSVFSYISYLLDACNTWILRESFRCADQFERQVASEGGVFSAIHVLQHRNPTYARVMGIVYRASAAGFVGLAVLALWACR